MSARNLAQVSRSRHPDSFLASLSSLGSRKLRVQIDPDWAPEARARGARVVRRGDRQRQGPLRAA